MRITGGTFRGRNLVAPPDARVRPTSDKARQAIFNILAHNDFGVGRARWREGLRPLRRHRRARHRSAVARRGIRLLVDDSAESRALIRTNVEALGLTGVTKIWRRDATDLGPMQPAAAARSTSPSSIRPIAKISSLPALAALRDGGWLSRNAIVVVETGEDETVTLPDGFCHAE